MVLVLGTKMYKCSSPSITDSRITFELMEHARNKTCKISTSSVSFRDETVNVMILAGYSPVIGMKYDVGENRESMKSGKQSIATAPCWKIIWTQAREPMQASLNKHQNISEVKKLCRKNVVCESSIGIDYGAASIKDKRY